MTTEPEPASRLDDETLQAIAAQGVVRSADLQAFVARHPDFARHLILKLTGRVRRLTRSARSLALDDAHTLGRREPPGIRPWDARRRPH